MCVFVYVCEYLHLNASDHRGQRKELDLQVVVSHPSRVLGAGEGVWLLCKSSACFSFPPSSFVGSLFLRQGLCVILASLTHCVGLRLSELSMPLPPKC